MTNSLTIHQHNLFQPARRRGNSPFRAPPLAAAENVSIERSAVVPIESRRAPGCAGPRPRGAAGGGAAKEGTARERAPPPPQRFHAEPGSPARRHVNWISFSRGGGKAQGLGLQRRLGRFIQGFIDRKKRRQGRLAARTQAHTGALTLTHTPRPGLLLPPRDSTAARRGGSGAGGLRDSFSWGGGR